MRDWERVGKQCEWGRSINVLVCNRSARLNGQSQQVFATIWINAFPISCCSVRQWIHKYQSCHIQRVTLKMHPSLLQISQRQQTQFGLSGLIKWTKICGKLSLDFVFKY